MVTKRDETLAKAREHFKNARIRMRVLALLLRFSGGTATKDASSQEVPGRVPDAWAPA